MSSSTISVLMFSNASVRSGAEEHILQLLTRLDRQQFRPFLACTSKLAELLMPDLPQDVQVCSLTLDRATDFAGAMRLIHFLRKHRIQILHSHMFRASLFASPLGCISRVPVVVETAHVREVWRKGWKASFVVDRIASSFVKQTIAVSNAIAGYLVQSKGIDESKITVIPTAPALSAPAQRHSSVAERKRALGVPEHDPLIVLAGRLESQKGHWVAIAAMKMVLAEFPRAQLVLLGEGSLRSELEQSVQNNHLDRNIRFAGYQRNVRDWFAAADLSVLPSFYEGLPMTALESLAEACPIVATAVDGTPEIVRDGKTGLLVPPGNPDRLSQAICRMLRDREFARHTAMNGQCEVLTNFTVDKLVLRTQEFYLNVWNQYRRRHDGHPAARPSQVTSL